MHPLRELLEAAADGRFPPPDGLVDVQAPMPGGHHAVVEFTGHAVILTDHEPEDAARRGADGFGGATHPDVVQWLAGPGGWIGSHDVVLVARGTGDGTLPLSSAHDDHPRVLRSLEHRRDVRVHADRSGIVTIGRGLVDRIEMSIERLPGAKPGAGRWLIAQGCGAVPPGQLVWAQVAPGNAASLRAFLSCGFTPIGAEILLSPRRSGTGPAS
jgi:hypothetical protein